MKPKMKRLIIILQILTIIILISLLSKDKVSSEPQDFYFMTSTGYTNHPSCTPNNKGITATQTKAHEGIVAINVDWVDDEWIIKSPLKLGQKIYIENVGIFSVEDTGSFTERNFHFDYWNLDLYFDTYEDAKEWGIKMVKVIVLKED